MKRFTSGVAAIGLAALCVLVFTATAGARTQTSTRAEASFASAVTVRTAQGFVPANTFLGKDFFAGCAPGEKVIGGGWSGGSINSVFPVDDHPTGRENFGVETWDVKLDNFGESAQRVFVHAICLNMAGVSGTVSVRTADGYIRGFNSNADFRDSTAGCAGGEKAIAGGWSARQPAGAFDSVLSYSDRPTGSALYGVDTWSVVLANFSDAPAAIRVYVVCASGALANAISVRGRFATSAFEGSSTFYSTCNPGERVVGGGWRSTEPAAVTTGAIFALDDRPVGPPTFGPANVEGWGIDLYNFGTFGGVTSDITVYASCLA